MTENECKYCFEGKNLISPCLCIGTMGYVHRHCLDKWKRTSCEICKYSYCMDITFKINKRNLLIMSSIIFLFCIYFYQHGINRYQIPGKIIDTDDDYTQFFDHFFNIGVVHTIRNALYNLNQDSLFPVIFFILDFCPIIIENKSIMCLIKKRSNVN